MAGKMASEDLTKYQDVTEVLENPQYFQASKEDEILDNNGAASKWDNSVVNGLVVFT